MYLENNSKAHRDKQQLSNASFFGDIEYLKNHFEKIGGFPLFSQVLLETRTDCNRKCKFCPQAHYIRPLKVMEWNVFTKVINELAEIGFSGRIAFFMTNEPLLETRLLEMIKYARSKSARFFLDITTNGKTLNSELLDDFFLSGLDNININDYRKDRGTSPNKISKYLESLISDFRHNPKVNYNRRSTEEVLSNYAGIISGTQRVGQTSFCNFPFRKLSISTDGNIVLCCNDYTYKTNFGNVMDKPLVDIWHSEELNIYRKNLLNEIRDGICGGCDEFQDYSVFT